MKLNKILNTTILIAVLLIGINTHSQKGNTIDITTTGTGLTKNNAINDALRNALEQTYGGFISSKTNITNDELFNDEVVAITSGEIHDYELISETKIESGYAVTIVAKISQTGLNNFVTQSGGDAVVFDANVFSTKIKLQRLNEKAEIKSINNILEILEEIYARSIEFEFTSSNPKINESNKKWRVDFELTTKYNENILSFIDYFSSSLEKIAMTVKQKTAYELLGKSTYPILVNNEFYYFRNADSYISINNFLINLRNKFSQVDIKTNNGLHVAGSDWFKENKSYLRNFFIPYLNHTKDSDIEKKGYMHDNGEVEGGVYSLRWQAPRNKYVYIAGFSGQDYTLSGRGYYRGERVPTSVGSGNIILMLNKDNRIQVKPNEEYTGSTGIRIGDIKGDGGNFTAGGEVLFMENSLDFEFSFNPNNKEIIYVNGIESTIDEYLSQKNNFIKPTYYKQSFSGGGLQDSYGMRWSEVKIPVDINNLNFSKKKMKRIQKRINIHKLNTEDLKLKLKNLVSSISQKIRNNYNDSKDLNHSARYNFYREFTEDEMFSITGYKLINNAKK